LRYKGKEAILSGPAETGKTYSALWKLHLCALKYPGASIVIARKTLTSTYSTVVVTFQNKVLGASPVQPYGGKKPQWWDYVNGSRVWVAGLDKSSKVLSAEHDIIYVNQAEELKAGDWETLTTRTTGRAGNMPYSQTIGDMNPAWPTHWIYSRPHIRMFYSKHIENPVLYNQETGEITTRGQETMEVLQALTGVRYDRLFRGVPAVAEGAIYPEFDPGTHLVDEVPYCQRYVAGVDWGYAHPGSITVWGIQGDRMYLVAQHYQTEKTDDWWRERAVNLQGEFKVEAWACDPSEPAYIQKFRDVGLNAIKGFNSVAPGISAVKQRLAGDRLFVARDSLRVVDERLRRKHLPTSLQEEIPAYVWSSRGNEIPVKENDHACDATRYAVAYVDGLGGNRPAQMGTSPLAGYRG
jgi:phage terminase large subunit